MLLLAVLHWRVILTDVITIGSDELTLVAHTSNLTGSRTGFASLAFHLNGSVVESSPGLGWLYTTAQDNAGKWTTDVRSLRLDVFAGAGIPIGSAIRALNGTSADRWATAHLVLKVNEGLWVAFYSTGRRARAAIGASARGPFVPDPIFGIHSLNAGWEAGCSIEADGGFSLETENQTTVSGWVMYDTLCAGSKGLIGWAKVSIDKIGRTVHLIARDSANPRNFSLPGRVAARTGGNLASDVTFGGLPAIFYLSKPSPQQYLWAVVRGGHGTDERVLEPAPGCAF